MRTNIGLATMLMLALVACSSSTQDGATGGGGSHQGDGNSGEGAGSPVECFEVKPGCVLASDATRIMNPDVPEEDREALAQGNTSFALDLGRALHSATANVIYSPFSVSTALAMAYAGARGTTEEAIAEAMRFTLPQDRLHPAFNYVDLELQKRAVSSREGGGFRLRTANAIWSDVDFRLEPSFLKVLVENYGAPVRLADFSNPPEAEGLINTWVSDRTDGNIPKLLNGDVNPDTKVVLVNAISFKAAWSQPFEEEATKPGTFRRSDGTTVSAEMMRGKQETRYGAGDGWEAVEIPYAGTYVSMILVMPEEGTVDTFEASLDRETFDGILDAMQHRSVDITMPKFSFRSSASLKGALQTLGMEIAFGPDANFSGMFSGGDPDTKGDLHIQDVIHEAFIDVNEAGTEAAAATAVIFGTTGSGFAESATIVLDRPFFFFIRDLGTEAILFAGRVNDPTAQ